VEALKLLERVIGVCSSRLDDCSLLQEVAIVIWNTAVPLLQAHLRQNAYRAFQLAAGCLEDIASPLMKLRAQLHFELAKCEEQNDFVVKAKEQTDKAMHADYGLLNSLNPVPATGTAPAATTTTTTATTEVPGEELDRRRNMDILIKPLDKILTLRSSVYDSPEDIEGQVLLMMQQIAESKSKGFQSDTLFRCIAAQLSAIQNPDDHRAANAILGNGAIPPPISKLKSSMTEPDLQEMNSVLDKFGSTAAAPAAEAAVPAPAKGKAAAEPVVAANPVEFSVFTELTQTRLNMMFSMAKTASKLGIECSVIVQNAACYILSFNWKPDDKFMRSLILQQIDTANMLAEALVIRIADCELSEEQEEAYMLALEGFTPNANADATTTTATAAATPAAPAAPAAKSGAKPAATPAPAPSAAPEEGAKEAPSNTIEPRCLGVVSPFASTDMQTIKGLIIRSLGEALKLALRVKDDYSVQNGIVFFWNLHLHVFRRHLAAFAMPQLLEFLKLAHTTLIAAKTAAVAAAAEKKVVGFYVPKAPEIDFRLCVAICEAYSAVIAAVSKDIPGAVDIAIKGCSQEQGGASAFVRRRLCEHAASLSMPPPAAAADAGAKAAPAKGGGAGEPPKFDHPFLNIFGTLVFAEAHGVTKEAVAAFAAKIRAVLDGELKDYIAKIDIPNLSKEQYDQLLELRACALTRLTRLYVSIGDVYGAYASAEECTKLIENSLTSDPATEGQNR
jgi:hypothetical protein